MRIVRDLEQLNLDQPAAVAIGNFDGVHVAHQELLRSVVQTSIRLSAVAAAITFEPHPTQVVAPERTPQLLTPLDQKAELIAEQGIDLLVIVPFTRELSRLSPLEFVEQILCKKLRSVSVHVGGNFRFGHQHAGDVALLRELARKLDFRVQVLPEIEVRGQRVSSSRIRELLSEGDVILAGRLLGRPYSMRGLIVQGSGVGKTLTVPTLNLAPVPVQHPRNGVYVTRTRLGARQYQSATNVGHKPTFGEHRLTVESFLLNFHGEIQTAEMEVEFLHRLRDEMKFPDPAALKAQIGKDVQRSLKFFRLLDMCRQKQTARVSRTQ